MTDDEHPDDAGADEQADDHDEEQAVDHDEQAVDHDEQADDHEGQDHDGHDHDEQDRSREEPADGDRPEADSPGGELDEAVSGVDEEVSRADTIAPDSAGEQPAAGPVRIDDDEDDDGEPTDDVETDAPEGTGPPVEDPLLRVRGLDAGYGDLQILTDVDLDVGDEEYVTIVGPNGAGKSTAMKSIFGLTNVMGGEIVFDGADITDLRPEDIIHTGIGYVPQSDNVFAGLSVLENLEMGAYILDEVPQERLREVYDRFPILEERKEQKAGTLSGGQQQMLAMGRALMLDPDLLLLDEPSAGLAPDLVEDMFDRIDAINEDGTAILMVEQNAKEALRRCDRGYVLVQGGNRYEDRGQVLLEDEEVRQQFLGG